MNILQTIEAEEKARLIDKRAIPDFQPGDTLRVMVKIKEGERERIQAFEGVCIARASPDTHTGRPAADAAPHAAAWSQVRRRIRDGAWGVWADSMGGQGMGLEGMVKPARAPTLTRRLTFICHSNAIQGASKFFCENYDDGDITIGNNVFIGAQCTILPGTIIKDNVVVASNSVVKGILEGDTVYGGSPAKVIKKID